LSRRGRMVVEFTTTSSGTPRAFPQVKKQARINRNYLAILATLQITSYVHSRNSSHDGSSSVKLKGNCFIDIDGIYDYHCLYTFFLYQSMKIIGLLLPQVKKQARINRNYSAILATMQITSYVHSRNSS
jgi:hypothetical protein